MAEVRYSESIEIAATPERIYDYRLDFATLPEYNPNVTNLRATGDGEYVFDLTLPGAPPMENPLRVVEATRPSRIVFDTGPGYMAREDCTFTPSGGGTRVTFEYTLTFPGAIDETTAALLSSSGAEQARLELENLKKLLEG